MIKDLPSKQIDVTAFSKEGFGRGFFENPSQKRVPIDIPFTMPGDRVDVSLCGKKKGLYRGKLLHIESPSKDRVTPLCSHFGNCGGCQWQHIDYVEQLKLKETFVRDLFRSFIHSDTKCFPIIPSEPYFRYRNKMELSFSSDKWGHRYLGLIIQGTRGHVFHMKECHLMNPWMAHVVSDVNEWWNRWNLLAFNPSRNCGTLRTLTLREGIRTQDRMIILTVSCDPQFALEQRILNDFVATCRLSCEEDMENGKLSIFLRLQQVAKGRATRFYEMLLHGSDHIREVLYIETGKNIRESFRFHISPSAFFQPNTLQAEKLYSKAIQLSELTPEDIVYDLYCGTGTLGICMARNVQKVVGIELSPESTLDANENVKINQLSNVVIETGDVGKTLQKYLECAETKPSLIMIDPPRAGLDLKAMNNILQGRPQKLTYISCNPLTQADNCAFFVKNGYQIVAIQSVDQFPHTSHVENIVTLRRT